MKQETVLEALDRADTALHITILAMKHAEYRLALHYENDNNVMLRLGDSIAFAEKIKRQTERILSKQ